MGRKKVEYKCEICGYTTNRKSRYSNHKARVTSCKPITEEEKKIVLKTNITTNDKDKKLELLLEEYKIRLKRTILEKEKLN